MTTADCSLDVPGEAWAFADQIGERESFQAYLTLAEEFFSPVDELRVVYDAFDPTFEDEQLTLDISVLLGGRHGADADLQWMKMARSRFGPTICNRITPYSHQAKSSNENR